MTLEELTFHASTMFRRHGDAFGVTTGRAAVYDEYEVRVVSKGYDYYGAARFSPSARADEVISTLESLAESMIDAILSGKAGAPK